MLSAITAGSGIMGYTLTAAIGGGFCYLNHHINVRNVRTTLSLISLVKRAVLLIVGSLLFTT